MTVTLPSGRVVPMDEIEVVLSQQNRKGRMHLLKREPFAMITLDKKDAEALRVELRSSGALV